MSEKQVNIQMPSWLWRGAIVTSAALAVLEAVGVAKVPWFVALLPIGLVIGFGPAVILALLVGGIVTVGIGLLIDRIDRNHRRKQSVTVTPHRTTRRN